MRGLCALALVLLAVAPAVGAAPIEVVTTSTDLKSLVEVVGRDLVRVASLALPIHDPHPHAVDVKPSQIAQIKSAALLVRAGLDDAPWLTRVLQAVKEPRLKPGGPDVLDCSKGISLLHTDVPRGREERAVHDSGNPHYLLDPDNARPVTAAIRDALARIAPPTGRDSMPTARASSSSSTRASPAGRRRSCPTRAAGSSSCTRPGPIWRGASG